MTDEPTPRRDETRSLTDPLTADETAALESMCDPTPTPDGWDVTAPDETAGPLPVSYAAALGELCRDPTPVPPRNPSDLDDVPPSLTALLEATAPETDASAPDGWDPYETELDPYRDCL